MLDATEAMKLVVNCLCCHDKDSSTNKRLFDILHCSGIITSANTVTINDGDYYDSPMSNCQPCSPIDSALIVKNDDPKEYLSDNMITTPSYNKTRRSHG